MKIITFQDIEKLKISPLMCYEWVENAIKNKGKAILPPKISLKPFDGAFCNVMPCMVELDSDTSFGGVKVVTRYPGRIPSLESYILLLDSKNGEMLALMDGTWITAMRTGAVAAHSIILFGKKNFETIGIMGLGNVSRAALLMLAEKDQERQLLVKLLKYKDQALSFSERFKSYRNIRFEIVDNYKDLVCDADVIISGATYLQDDICSDECFKEGVLVVPIHTRGFTNCDLFFDKVFADDVGHVKHFKNFDRFNKFSEVSEVVNGRVLGREKDSERIIVYNIGISIHDIYYAGHVYDIMERKGILDNLPEVSIDIPTEKHWV